MTPEEIRLLPFFWSVRRRRYWNQCRRRYFLHYYLARLGRYEEADPDCREACELDRRVTARAFVRIMLCRAIAEMFRSGTEGSVAAAAELNARYEVNRMIKYPDSVKQIISEIADGNFSQTYTLRDMMAEIRKGGERIDANFWTKIQYIPKYYRKMVEQPQKVDFMELACYFVPALAFANHGEMWILESCSVQDAGDLISCLHRMWVANELKRDPTKVRSLYLDENFEVKQLDELTSVSAFLDEIKQDIHNMTEAEQEGFVSLRDFPPSPGSGCAACQFFKFCSKRGTFKAES